MTNLKHVDVAVVGAGPAGLAAAIRVRWVKTYRSVPCSVAVFDPAPPGGLARFRSTRLTGPGFHLSNKALISRLRADVNAYHIPLETTPIDELRRAGDRWRLLSGENVVCESRAAIVATGLRRLANEADYFGRGVSLTSNGYDYLPDLLRRLTAREAVRTLLVIGNAKTRNLVPVIQAALRKGLHVRYLIDAPPDADLAAALGDVVFGAPRRFLGHGRLREIEIETADGRSETLATDVAFIDYTAFEVQPQAGPRVDGLARTPEGFILATRDGTTNLPGLFAAGDVTGLFAMAIKALAEGSISGFTAYRHVFVQKFGYEPPLFAYAAADRAIDPDLSDYPELRPTDGIRLLGDEAAVHRVASDVLGKSQEGIVLPCPVGDLDRELGLERSRRFVYALLDEKLCTIEPVEESPRGPARRA